MPLDQTDISLLEGSLSSDNAETLQYNYLKNSNNHEHDCNAMFLGQ